MRSLCIAAYLRCLYAAIEWSPDPQFRDDAIRIVSTNYLTLQLKEEFVFRVLTQLCDTTGWFECNIGAKYLRVMRHVIK